MKRPPTDVDTGLRELFGLYEELDAAYAGATCEASTECCRFGRTGREPYVTSIEWSAIDRARSRNGGPLPARKRALPLVAGDRDERTCPLLDIQGRCSVYDSRPFGCRTYFCERASVPSAPDRRAQKEFVNRLRDIAARHEPGGEAPRPLSRLFERGRADDWK
jgi:hypothetical protein